MARVLTVTTSMGTKWEAYSQALLQIYVPEWKRKIVNGRRNWKPTNFIESVIDQDVDYIVHIDEDCFVQSRESLLDIINIFENDTSVVAAGIPDGGYYYRNHNPAALNLFFVVFRADALRLVWAERAHWDKYHFLNEFADEVLRQCPNLDHARINWDEGEPYYSLFWSMLSRGGRFLYLHEQLFQPRWSSCVFTPSGEILAEHMWYLRHWFSDKIMPGHDCPNSIRYKRFVDNWRSTYGKTSKHSLILSYMHVRRLLRRLFS